MATKCLERGEIMNKNNPSPMFLNLNIGAIVAHGNKNYLITNLLDVENILAKDIKSGQIKRLRVAEITTTVQKSDKEMLDGVRGNITTIADEDWNEAVKRFEIIHPLLAMGSNRTRNIVNTRATEFGKDASTLYRWISVYESTGLVSSLIRSQRSDKGQTRVTPEVEELIKTSIEDLYLSKQKHSIKSICEHVLAKCKNAGLPLPHANTIRKRIAAISDELKMSRRWGAKKAAYIYQEHKGSFPGADYPLAFVQIDHTKLDIILVDDILRRPIGRPWITLAIDVFSRMVCGFYISFDPPGAMATGLCVAHAVLPKENWLVKRDISGSWPIWGTPDNLHLDNAKEFRGNMLRRACQEYGININWRPVARPHFGGHIERMLGTLSKEIHELPGTTFSNPTERGEYDSEKNAAMTLSEFEKWLTIYIIDVYHKRIHSEIKTAPERKWEEGLFGGDNTPGRGLPPRTIDDQRLLLDFMPYEERTIQEYGVVIDEIHYYSDVLRRWINSSDINNPKIKRKFIFKRDPRNISKIYFFDPELNLYFPIPYRDISRPAISIWELREAQRFVKDRMASEVNESSIFVAYDKMSKIEKESLVKSKKARRSFQRRLDSINRKDYIIPNLNQTEVINNSSTDEDIPNITPFDDIDEDVEL